MLHLTDFISWLTNIQRQTPQLAGSIVRNAKICNVISLP
uniref:Uncharacterized protein n=1 Tax=Anguilla anguilla TaxID=7936 RepID=A0A0E9SDQ0_ANGAN